MLLFTRICCPLTCWDINNHIGKILLLLEPLLMELTSYILNGVTSKFMLINCYSTVLSAHTMMNVLADVINAPQIVPIVQLKDVVHVLSIHPL